MTILAIVQLHLGTLRTTSTMVLFNPNLISTRAPTLLRGRAALLLPRRPFKLGLA